MQRKKLQILIGALAVLILIIVLAVILGGRSAAEPEPEVSTEAGVAYLRRLAAGNPDEVTEELKAIHRRELEELREQRLRQLESGEISVWSLFEDYVLLGDSRAVGFWFYDYLPEERVLAESGATIRRFQEHIPDIVALNPSTVFLCYGLNDVFVGIWSTPEEYVAEYAQIIGELREQLPDVKIYVSSTLPAKDPAFDTSTDWYNIPLFNEAVKAMCQSIDNCWYVDNDQLAIDYADMWEVDGIHLSYYLYPHWATNLIMEVYSSGLDWDGEGGEAEGTAPEESGEAEDDGSGRTEEPGDGEADWSEESEDSASEWSDWYDGT